MEDDPKEKRMFGSEHQKIPNLNEETGEGIFTLSSPEVAGGEVVAAIYQGQMPNQTTWTEFWLYRVGVYQEPSCAGPLSYQFDCIVDSPGLPPTPTTAGIVNWMRVKYPALWGNAEIHCDTHVVTRENFPPSP